jgi:chromosome segregation ATPase
METNWIAFIFPLLALTLGGCAGSDPDLVGTLEAEVASLEEEVANLGRDLGDEQTRYVLANDSVNRLTEEAKACEEDKAVIRTEIEGGCLAHVVDLEGKIEWARQERRKLRSFVTFEQHQVDVCRGRWDAFKFGDDSLRGIRRERSGE